MEHIQITAMAVAEAIAMERERCAKIVDARTAVWDAAARKNDGSCAESLSDECSDIAAAIRSGQ